MNRRELMIASSLLAMRPALGFAQSEKAATSSRPGSSQLPSKILLGDYLPQSIYRIPKTEVPKAKFRVFDGHDHGHGDLSVAEMVKIMDKVGVEKSVIFTGAGTVERFKQRASEYAKYPGRFEPWCMFDLRGITATSAGPHAIESLEACHRAGAKGIGELHDKGQGMFSGQETHRLTPAQLRVERLPLNGGPTYTRGPKPPNPHPAMGPHPDDPRLDPLWEKAGQLGMPVSFHVSDPVWSFLPMDNKNDGLMNGWTWQIVVEPPMYNNDQLVESLERAVHKHPGTIFIACHLANLSYDVTRLGEMLDRNPNLYADIAARFSETATIPRFMNRFLTKYSDRIIYGTDVDYSESFFGATFRILETEDEHFYLRGKVDTANFNFNYHWPSNGFGLSDDVLKKIYYDNMAAIMERAQRRGA